MEVVFSNRRKGALHDNVSKNLYVQNRFTKEAWQELEDEMIKLDIIKFADPLLSTLGADLISIKYVRNQIAAH